MRISTTVLCLATSLAAWSCTSISSSMMVPGKVEIEHTFGGSVRIETVGSERQAIVGSRLISAGELEDAVREVILRSHLFEFVVEEGEADHVLLVEFERIDEPEIALDAECRLSLRWRLKSGDGKHTVWEQIITTKETVNSYQETDSSKRSMAVIEKTVRTNLRKGIEKLSKSQGPQK